MESVPMWQFISLATLLSWIVLSSYVNLTLKLRSLIQPWVIHHVIKDTPFILQIQRLFHCSFSDRLFSAMSCVVSVPFYTAFLPFLFWSGHGKLARQMTLLIALCDYMGNCIKDVVSAPRPSSPPVRRVTDTKEEKGNVLEYGLPSSHTLNTVCLSGFLLHYTLHYTQHTDTAVVLIGFSLTFLFVGMMVVGRIYLGMHSVVDIIAGLVLGLVILASWITVHDYVDSFVVSGQNVTSFWVALSFLLLFAYPTPEFPTPSYEFHTAFNGVALGIGFKQGLPTSLSCIILSKGHDSLGVEARHRQIWEEWVSLSFISRELGCSQTVTKSTPILAEPSGIEVCKLRRIQIICEVSHFSGVWRSNSESFLRKREPN